MATRRDNTVVQPGIFELQLEPEEEDIAFLSGSIKTFLFDMLAEVLLTVEILCNVTGY